VLPYASIEGITIFHRINGIKKDEGAGEIKMVYRRYMCLLCGYIYDEEKGWPEDGIAPGTRWEDVSLTWQCPECGAMKEDFEMMEI
jgi:rubredoxin